MKRKKDDISRREFLKNTAALSALPIIASCSNDHSLPSTVEMGGGPATVSSRFALKALEYHLQRRPGRSKRGRAGKGSRGNREGVRHVLQLLAGMCSWLRAALQRL